MKEQIRQLVCQVQSYPRDTQERQQALGTLVKQILRSRKICRPSKGQPLSGIYRDILEAVQKQLTQDLEQTIDRYSPQFISDREWTSWRDMAFKKVIDNYRLEQLAIEAQGQKTHTKERLYALTELINALQISGKLYHPPGFSIDVYQDAVIRTLGFVFQNINVYNPDKGKFLKWVNFRLYVMLQEVRKELNEPFIQSQYNKVFRTQSDLKRLIKKTKNDTVLLWFQLILKGRITVIDQGWQVFYILIVLLNLSQLLTKKPIYVNTLLFEMAQASLPLLSTLSGLNKKLITIENIPQSEIDIPLSEKVRQYIDEDPDRLFQKHIRNHPEATFQTIALAYLDGKKWKEISKLFGISVPTLSHFYQRCLKEVAPKIKKSIQE
ncbi:hypothetical protein [Moorena sp. SIO4G3]|uniref:hypothetical protein n=1 Tax=Moorena sp. SIO4G3 TaxID=2607821 RepID=UPI00142B43AE|nr:hypothetical protein [Moorena sp. SIO4G3]NEO81721.1 hypothetical protein [Moorena sp. SIO4G3]